MPQYFRNLHKARTVHRKIAGRAVPQVMEAEVRQGGGIPGILPGLADVDRALAVPAREQPFGRGCEA